MSSRGVSPGGAHEGELTRELQEARAVGSCLQTRAVGSLSRVGSTRAVVARIWSGDSCGGHGPKTSAHNGEVEGGRCEPRLTGDARGPHECQYADAEAGKHQRERGEKAHAHRQPRSRGGRVSPTRVVVEGHTVGRLAKASVSGDASHRIYDDSTRQGERRRRAKPRDGPVG